MHLLSNHAAKFTTQRILDENGRESSMKKFTRLPMADGKIGKTARFSNLSTTSSKHFYNDIESQKSMTP